MKFRSDSHRKAVFANMFGSSSSKRTKVGSKNVKNFEVSMKKSMKLSKVKPIRFDYNRVKMKDVRAEAESESCKFCKKKGGDLELQVCKVCAGEFEKEKEEKEKLKRSIPDKLKKIQTMVELSKFQDDLERIEMLDSKTRKLFDDKFDELVEGDVETYNPGKKRTWPAVYEKGNKVYRVDEVIDNLSRALERYNPDKHVILRSNVRLRGRSERGRFAIYWPVGRKRTEAEEREIRGQREEIERMKPFVGWAGYSEFKHTDDLVKGGWRNHINHKGKHWTFVGTYETESRLGKAVKRAREKFPGHTLKQMKANNLYKSPFSSNYPRAWMGFTSSTVGSFALYREEKRTDFLNRYHGVN